MPRLFNKLPGFRRTPPGSERDILRLLPRLFWRGTLLLCLPSVLLRLWLGWQPEGPSETLLLTTDIYVVSLVILHWTALLTIGIAAFIVMVMKGPAYVADAYPLIEKDDCEKNDSTRRLTL